MAADTNIFMDNKTNNWFKACIALNFTKEGLTHFVETEVKHVHTAIGRSCGKCFTENLVRCPTKGICKNLKNCNYHTKTKQPRQCPTKLCDLAAKSITSQHRYNGPSWLNTKAELWSTDHWQIAKCFFPPDGYINVSSIHETDFNGVISVLLNCKHFDSCISFTIAPKQPAPECLLTRARQIGRAVRHTPDCKVTDDELRDFFHTLDTLLADPKCLAMDPAATSARTKLFDLQNDRLSLTELGELLKEANQTLIQAKEAGERFSEKAERTLTEGLNTLEAAIHAGKERLDNKIQAGEQRIENVAGAGVTEVNATVIRGEQVIESATMEGRDAVTSALEDGVKEVNATVIRGEQIIESATIEGRDAVTSALEEGVKEVNSTVIRGEQIIESATMEGRDAVTSALEDGVKEVNATVIRGEQIIESATMEGRDAVTSALEDGVKEVNATVIRGEQIIESATMEGRDAVTSALEDGVKVVNDTVIRGEQIIESATMEGRDAVTCATQDSLKEVNATVIIGQQVIESATIEGIDSVTSATGAGVTEVNATVIKGQQIIEAGVTKLSNQVETHLRELQSVGEKVKADLTGIKTHTEDEEYALQCNDLLRRLVDHYRDTVSFVPLSTLDPSLDKHVQDVFATPKIHRIKIENDGRRTKQEQVFAYKDCFYRSDHLYRRAYLQGDPGSGKTTFASKLVYDWCNVHALFTESTNEQTAFGDVDTLFKFKFLFFISLRDSREEKNVTQMLKTQLIYKIYAEDEWESAYKLVLQIMKNVMYLVIQDGLDEWPGKETLPSMDGIPKNQCIVLTTSRPWKLADERIKNSEIDILLELEGISDPQEFNERILRRLLDETKDLKDTVQQFEEFLESRDLESISSSPMLHTLVLCTWVNDMAESLTGSSMCELYTTMLENLCKKANPQISYFDQYQSSPVNCFASTKYIKPNMEHIDVIAKAAFSFLFTNKKETSLVFSDINLSAHLSETSKQFALDSGLLSKRKGKKCTDQTLSFVHKTIQEFLSAFHIDRNADVIGDVISGYLKRHDNSYRDISQMFIFLCGFNISAANKLSALMNDLDINSDNHHDFQKCILSGYKEAVANKNTPIVLHLSHFNFSSDNAEDLIKIWALNTSRARSLYVYEDIYFTIRSQGATSFFCQGPGSVSFSARDYSGLSTRADQEEGRSSASCMEFDLSSCHSLERLVLRAEIGHRIYDDPTVLPNALLGLKKLKYLEILQGCNCEALDLSHCEHIESITFGQGVTLLPLSLNNYKTLNCIKLYSTYDGLDLSLFENLNSITINRKVKVLPKPLPMHNKLTYIGVNDFDFNSFDNEAIHTWCLLNGADPLQSAGYTPVLSSVEHIELSQLTCSSTWLRSLLRTLLTLDHRVDCVLFDCNITSSDHEVKSLEDSYSIILCSITTDLNNTCTIAAGDLNDDDYCPGLWETLLDQNINHLSLIGRYLKVNNVSSMSRSLASLSQLETLTMNLHAYIDLQLPPLLKHLTIYYDCLSPSELRHLVNKLSARSQSVECRLEFGCGYRIPPEEYIPIKQELEAREHVEVKQFRVYDWTPNTDIWSADVWSVRDSFGDDEYGDDIADDELCFSNARKYMNVRSRISMWLNINCV